MKYSRLGHLRNCLHHNEPNSHSVSLANISFIVALCRGSSPVFSRIRCPIVSRQNKRIVRRQSNRARPPLWPNHRPYKCHQQHRRMGEHEYQRSDLKRTHYSADHKQLTKILTHRHLRALWRVIPNRNCQPCRSRRPDDVVPYGDDHKSDEVDCEDYGETFPGECVVVFGGAFGPVVVDCDASYRI